MPLSIEKTTDMNHREDINQGRASALPNIAELSPSSPLVPNWGPLERKLGRNNRRLASWMWMYRKTGLEYYKHIDTRKYLVLDNDGTAYIGGWMPVDFWVGYRKATEVQHNG